MFFGVFSRFHDRFSDSTRFLTHPGAFNHFGRICPEQEVFATFCRILYVTVLSFVGCLPSFLPVSFFKFAQAASILGLKAHRPQSPNLNGERTTWWSSG